MMLHGLSHYAGNNGVFSHVGIIGAVARDFFRSDVTMEIVSQLEELERTGKSEHVVFLVTQRPVAEAAAAGASSQSLQPRTVTTSHNPVTWTNEVYKQPTSGESAQY